MPRNVTSQGSPQVHPSRARTFSELLSEKKKSMRGPGNKKSAPLRPRLAPCDAKVTTKGRQGYEQARERKSGIRRSSPYCEEEAVP